MVDFEKHPTYEEQKRHCKECGKEIKFVKHHESGVGMAVDNKLLKFITQSGKVTYGYIPHWDTCPNPRNKIEPGNRAQVA